MLIDFLALSATRQPDAPALIAETGMLTYAQLVDAIRRTVEKLAQGEPETGMRIALILPNSFEYVIYYYALLHLGAIIVPISPSATQQRLRFILTHVRAREIFASKHIIDWLAEEQVTLRDCRHRHIIEQENSTISGAAQQLTLPPPVVDAGTPALIRYTAGWTGDPKGAVHAHANLAGTVRPIWSLYQFQPSDRVLASIPLSHPLAQAVCMNVPLATGAQVYFTSEIDPEAAVRTIHDSGITIIAGTPELYEGILACDPAETSLSSLRLCLSTERPLDQHLHEQFSRNFSRLIHQCYCLSEFASIVASNSPSLKAPAGTVGKCLRGMEIEILDDEAHALPVDEIGQIAVRGYSFMDRYFDDPHATKRNQKGDWFLTGDLGKLDEEGNLTFLDKQQDVIVKAGFPVYSAEIESVLEAHPAVQRAAVIGVADDQFGQDIQAHILPVSGARVEVSDLVAHCNSRIAAYKVPARFIMENEFPLTEHGKVLKRMFKTRD